MGKVDLGSYYVKVEFDDGDGFVEPIRTGQRLVPRDTSCGWTTVGLDYVRHEPVAKDEIELADIVLFQYLEGGSSCDCNKSASLSGVPGRYRGDDKVVDHLCGDTMDVARITLIRPTGEEITIYTH